MNKENVDTSIENAGSSPSTQSTLANESSEAKKSTTAEAVAATVSAPEKAVDEKVVAEQAAESRAESPVVELPVAELPVAEIPAAESAVTESPIADSPIVESPIDLQTLNNPNTAPMRAAADLLQQASLALLQEAGSDAEAETPAQKTRFVLRRGKLSEEQIATRKERLGAIRQRTLRAVRENGAGQALAWLESKSQEEDVALLRETLCAALTIPNEEGSLLRSYSELDSVSAVLFRERLVSSLNGLTIEVE